MLLPGAWGLLLATAGAASPAASVPSGPQLRLSAGGDCPTVADLRRAFSESRVTVTDDPAADAWTLSAIRDAGGHASRFDLRAADGTIVFQREVQGDDCAGIAGVAAVVVEAYFTEVHLIVDAPPDRRAEAPAREEPAPPPSPWWLSLGASAGLALYADPALTAGAGEVSASVRHEGWGVGVAVAYATPTTQRTALDRVRRTELGLQLDLSLRLALGAAWLEPGVALSALRSDVAALDLPGEPSTVRFDFGGGAYAAAGLPLTGAVSLVATASAAVLILRDHYEIEPSGVVARSPGERFFFGLGLRVDLRL
jgi:hypothetical protein